VVNWRLENPPAADVEVSRHMGLFAVAHLADRHGIRVRLRKATGAGLIAHVWLPEALISHDSKPTSWDHVRTERASAVIEAVTRAARFPQDPATAVALAAAPFAAAPLAEAPITIVPPGQTPAAPQAGAQQTVVPQPQRPQEIRLPIFESVESDWFRTYRRQPPRAGVPLDAHRAAVLPDPHPAGVPLDPGRAGVPLDPHRAAPSWTSPSDEGWRAAEKVLAPAVGGVTAAGLPRRTPKANLVPGSADTREKRPARPADSAEAISSRLAGFQRGSRRARAAASSAQSSDDEP